MNLRTIVPSVIHIHSNMEDEYSSDLRDEMEAEHESRIEYEVQCETEEYWTERSYEIDL